MTQFRIYPDLLYLLPVQTHNIKDLTDILAAHPEIRFVSFVGIDLAGNDTDEKIPISDFLDNLHGYLNGHVVQTDGSSVVLPGIATLNDGRVDFEPDKDVIWYIDYNYEHPDPSNGNRSARFASLLFWFITVTRYARVPFSSVARIGFRSFC